MQITKYHGIQLDDGLTFDHHMDYLYGKLVEKLGVIREAREYLDVNTSSFLYSSLVCRTLTIVIWCVVAAKQQICKKIAK